MTEQTPFFGEAAREAAARAMDSLYGRRTAVGGTRDAIVLAEADRILTAAVNADPRAKAFLKLAALTDEELGRIVAESLTPAHRPSREIDRPWGGSTPRARARQILAALGLPVVCERCRGVGAVYTGTGGFGNGYQPCSCAKAEQEPTGGER